MTEIPMDIKALANAAWHETIDGDDNAIARAILEARDKVLDEASEIAHSILLVDSQPIMASHVSTAILAIKEPKP